MEDNQATQRQKFITRVKLLLVVIIVLGFAYSLVTSGVILGTTIRTGARRLVELCHFSSNDKNVDVAVKLTESDDVNVALTATYAMLLLAPNASESGREAIVKKLSVLCDGDTPQPVKCYALVCLDSLGEKITCDACE